MAVWTYELATEYSFPNISVYRKYRDGVHVSWYFSSNEGYVMYDTTKTDTETNPDTLEEIPVTYYYTRADCPIDFPFDNFTWVAVPRDSVDENYVYG